MRKVIDRADVLMAGPSGKREWTTDDLADFVEGLVICALDTLAVLRPEHVCEMHAHEVRE